MFDYHVHSDFSSDSDSKMEDMIIHAISLGVKTIAFTEHVDFDYPTKYKGQFPFLLDVDSYLDTFNYCKDVYSDKINLLFGVEIGLAPHTKNEIDNLVKLYNFDFVIGSTHVVDKLDLYEGDFFVGKSKREAYVRYFEDVYNSIKLFDCFDVYGHIDYINRYGNFSDRSLIFDEYKDYYEQIFKALIDKGCGIEINTSGFRYGLNQIHPQLLALEFYKQLGGKLVTIGSDAHKESDICAGFDYALSLVRQVGLSLRCND